MANLGRWFRAYDEAIDDPKLIVLSDKLHRFLFHCWCMASKNSGVLPPISEISIRVRKTESCVAKMVEELVQATLLERDNGVLRPHNWNARQFKSDVSTSRVKAFRERRRNVSETPPYTETDADTENTPQTPNAADAACSVNGNSHEAQTALDLPGVVRPDVPAPAKAKKRKTGKRSTEEIEHVLGPERLVWWHKFWEVFPCHEGINPAMDAFERKAVTREIALAMHAGAKRYAAKVAAAISRGEDIRMKWGQGWINDERWKDEDAAPPVPERKEPKFFDTKALRETETPVPPGWKVGM